MLALATLTTIGVALGAPSSSPLCVEVVRDGVPVSNARVWICDEPGDERFGRGMAAGEILRDDFERWFATRAQPYRTDMAGLLRAETRADSVWVVAEVEGLRALDRIDRWSDPRHVVLALKPDSPMTIRVADSAGTAVADASVVLQFSGVGSRGGSGCDLWRGRSDATGSVEIPHFGFVLRESTMRTETLRHGLSVRVGVSDGRSGHASFTPTHVSGRRTIVVTVGESFEPTPPSPRPLDVTLLPVDAQDRPIGGLIHVTATHDPSAPFGRRTFVPWGDGGAGEPLRFSATPPLRAESLDVELSGRFGELLRGTVRRDGMAQLHEWDLGRIVLHPAPLLVGGRVDRGGAEQNATIRLILYSSELPVTELDHDAAWSCSPDPHDPERILWPRRWVCANPDGTYRIDAPPGRWYVQAEVEGWWRSAPVRVDRDRIDFVTTDDCRLEPRVL